MPKENQVLKNKISYCGQMPYEENLKRIRKTRCMLEIMQQGGHGYTLRYCEAIAMGKKLATNNPEIEKAPFYKKEFISVFKSVEEFDPQFILNGDREVDYNYLPELPYLQNTHHFLEYHYHLLHPSSVLHHIHSDTSALEKMYPLQKRQSPL